MRRRARRLVTTALACAAMLTGCGGRVDLLLVDDGTDAGSIDSGSPDTGPIISPTYDASPTYDGGRSDAPTHDAAEEPPVVVQVEAGGTCCGEEQNTDYPPDTNCSGITIAWQYIPSCDFSVARIELHKSGGTVALLDGNGGGPPGATLWSAQLPSSPTGDPAWEGADVVPPIPLQAGRVYYLEESDGTCSIATSGVEYPYYGLSIGGSWDGPYQSHAWTSHVIGTCH
jgi:hypothetical protein